MTNELFSSPVTMLGASVLITLVPILFLLISPFLKLSIVFGVLRTGFGTQGIPGTAALSALSLILSINVLSPVIMETAQIIEELSRAKVAKSKTSSLEKFAEIISVDGLKIFQPIEKFLQGHIGKKEEAFFSSTNFTSIKQTPRILVLIPAFVLSELKTAFEMSLTLFLPFFVIDIVVTSLLTAMGMMMINPVNLTFPIKLLLFINCDGWLELTKSLILSYK